MVRHVELALRVAGLVVILAAVADKRKAMLRALAVKVPAGMIPRAEWLVTRDAVA